MNVLHQSTVATPQAALVALAAVLLVIFVWIARYRMT